MTICRCVYFIIVSQRSHLISLPDSPKLLLVDSRRVLVQDLNNRVNRCVELSNLVDKPTALLLKHLGVLELLWVENTNLALVIEGYLDAIVLVHYGLVFRGYSVFSKNCCDMLA